MYYYYNNRQPYLRTINIILSVPFEERPCANGFVIIIIICRYYRIHVDVTSTICIYYYDDI